MTYDWKAILVLFFATAALTRLGTFLAFKVPALDEMRSLNREADKAKLSRKRFREAVTVNAKVGLVTNLVFLFAIMPWFISLEPRPWWQYVVEAVAVLLVFDFFYYLTHRFAFHGRILRKVHSLHHQARTPTYIDAQYVHPLETFIGLMLFLCSTPLLALFMGPLHAGSVVAATLIFTQVNTINHTYVNLPRFPFKTLDYVTGVHAAHHVDMNQGNFATLTMLYDWLFGTYEKPVSRPTA